jgi:uncharacterized protein (TIGR03435 family)
MSEQIYSWLLRLYPPRFQESYRGESLQLFRDRSRDERGFLSGLRLWLDLLSDLAVSIPSSYRTVATAVATAYDGGPSFHSLEDEALNFSSLAYGLIASLAIYTVILLLFSHAGRYLPIHSSDLPQSSPNAGAAVGSHSDPAANTPSYSGASAKPAPGVSLSYAPFPPTSGSTVSFTAKVLAPDGKPTPTGTVRFFDEDSLVNTGELSNGSVTVIGKLPNLTTHFLRAIYSGDNNYSAAASLNAGRAAAAAQPAKGVACADEVVKPLTFDVVSIHEDKSGLGPRTATNGPTPDGYQMRNGPLLTLIQTAYLPSEGSMSFRLKQMTGLPTWAYSVLYDVDAKVSEADLPAWKDPALQPAMLRSMLQAMLADRFKFMVHRENKVVPIYDLTVGKRGPKFKPYNGATLTEIQQKHPGAHMLAGGVIAASGPNPGQQSFFGVTMSQLGTLLSNLAGRPVLDKTGLKGRYDVSYQIELLSPPPQTDGVVAPPPSPDSDFFRSQISTIVEDQLGLKPKPGTGPVESLVIDHVEQPSEN